VLSQLPGWGRPQTVPCRASVCCLASTMGYIPTWHLGNESLIKGLIKSFHLLMRCQHHLLHLPVFWSGVV
jgi:hypothetical protein